MLEKTPLFAESWNVAWRQCPTGSIIDNKETPFNIIKNSVRYWAADPFLFSYDGETYIFAELYDYVSRKGIIGCCKWDGKRFGRWKAIIREPYHLSYPFIFEHKGSVYIMPESGADGSLYLYRATAFPLRWEKLPPIRKGVVYGDTTLFCHDNRAFAVTYDVENPRQPNLVLLDIEKSENDCKLDFEDVDLRRPAGKYFICNGEEFRPAQNCREDYGKSILFYRYSFENRAYSEECVGEVFPQELLYSKKVFLDGMHTYNSDRKFEVIDIKTRRFNLLNLFSRIIGKMR